MRYDYSAGNSSHYWEYMAVLVLLLIMQSFVVDAGMVSTQHNLTVDGSGPGGEHDDKALCVFCHTPQGKKGSRLGWSRSQTVNIPFSTFDSFGRSGVADSGSVGSVSLACLSCHDGAQALNIVTKVTRYSRMLSDIQGVVISMPDMMNNSPFVVDVSKSHPVRVQYGGVTFNSQEYQSLESDVLDDVTVWWVETGRFGRQRSDLHLYTRTVNDTDTVYIECATCHDPHSSNPLFMRKTNDGSALCLSCHIK